MKAEEFIHQALDQRLDSWEAWRELERAIVHAEDSDFPSEAAYRGRQKLERAKRRLEWHDETKEKLDNLAMAGRHFTERRKILDLWRTRAARYSDPEARLRIYRDLLIQEGYLPEEQAMKVPIKLPPTDEELAERAEAYQEVQVLNQGLKEIVGASSDHFEAMKVYNKMGGALTANKLDTFADKLVQENLLPAFWRQKKQARSVLDGIRKRLRGEK